MSSTLTTDAEIRIAAIESALTSIWDLLQMAISKEQFNRLNIIRQEEITNLTSRIDLLETLVNTLQEEVDNLL